MSLSTSIKIPRRVSRGDIVKADDFNAILAVLEKLIQEQRALAIRPGDDIGVRSSNSSGTILCLKRKPSTSDPSTLCPFGEISTWTEGEGEGAVTKTGIRGGVVYAGDKVWNVSAQEINLSVSGSWLLWLSNGVTANHADGVLLPGLETSDEPAWDKIASGSGGYPDQTIPTTDTGTAIIALGTLTVADGSASFDPAGCGNIQINHCPGTLTHTRV